MKILDRYISVEIYTDLICTNLPAYERLLDAQWFTLAVATSKASSAPPLSNTRNSWRTSVDSWIHIWIRPLLKLCKSNHLMKNKLQKPVFWSHCLRRALSLGAKRYGARVTTG
ncbi:uncharacterized protein LOC132266717 isoform X2 [Cornus florida]|uniref:uncharacterized protein LOC132266717 isoform X2 n=1 Tax=Cornus florida TaxID=4283 RepID=UPI00289B8285|nr:uncharacterized protein LOC132266717 isoform X2 [Cornus florida]